MVLQIMLNSGWQCKSLFGYRGEPLYAYPSTFIQVPGFPKMGVPPKSSGCSIVDHPAIGVPMGPSISGTQHMLLGWQKFHQGFPTGFPAIACIGISPGGPWVRIDCIDAVRLRRRLSEHVLFVMDIRFLWASSGRIFRKMCIMHRVSMGFISCLDM